jgi:hypothetical protein
MLFLGPRASRPQAAIYGKTVNGVPHVRAAKRCQANMPIDMRVKPWLEYIDFAPLCAPRTRPRARTSEQELLY